MKQLLFGQDELVKNYVASLIPGESFSNDARAIGVVDGTKLLGGAVYSDFREMTHGNDMFVHAGFAEKGWASRRILAGLFAYPFVQCNCTRVTTITAKGNKKARAFDEKLGFQYVGKLTRGWDGKRDAIVYEMLKENCKWLKYSDVHYRRAA